MIEALKPIGEVTAVEGSLGDLTVITWRGEQPPIGTILYTTLPSPISHVVGGEKIDFPKILYVCEACFAGNQESCGNDRDGMNIVPDGRWLCDGCRDDENIDVSTCKSVPELFTAPPATDQKRVKLSVPERGLLSAVRKANDHPDGFRSYTLSGGGTKGSNFHRIAVEKRAASLVEKCLLAKTAHGFEITQAGRDYLSPPPITNVVGSKPVVSVKTMRLGDGRADYFVSIKVGNREVTPHVFREEYKAAYHVALYSWLLNGTDKPDLMAFDEGEWPAQATENHGWQPIETAPKNKKVLAAYRNENGKWRTVTACYHTHLPWSDEYGDHEDEGEYAPEAWYEENDSSDVIYPTSCKPTHWQPLPAHPLLASAEVENG